MADNRTTDHPRRFRVNTPSVVADVIDGETVIMNLKSGQYFSTQDSGSLLWQAVSAGSDADELVTLLTRWYVAQPGDIPQAVQQFVDTLLENELVVDRGDLAPEDRALDSAGQGQALMPFVPPTLSVYSDMQDLLLLDPIHDVDDAGWPAPKA